METLNIVTIEDINVAQVEAENGPKGAPKAFDTLESKMPSLKGRKMFGVFYPKKGEYFACFKLDDMYSDAMGFEKGVIPGGKYARRKIVDWENKIKEIGPAFEELGEECNTNGYQKDNTRPSVEFYRSQKELIIMLPIV